jgi:Family of unknown function (DUF6056)
MKTSPPPPARAVTYEAVAIAVAGVGAAAVLGLAAVYLFLAWPALDDFCRAALDPRVGGPFGQVIALYLNWTGRWLVTGLHAVLATHLDLEGPGFTFVLVLLAFAWIAAFVLAAGLILGRGARRRETVGLGLLLFAVFWAGAPGPGEVLYWYSGAVDYGLAFLLMMVALRLLLGGAGTGRALAAAAVGFLATGVHELAGGMVAVAALAQALYGLREGERRLARLSGLVLGIVAVGLLINLAAPGNATRAAQMPFGGQLRTALALTLKPSETPLRDLLDLRLLALGAFLLALPGFRERRPAWTQLKLPWLFLLPAATLALLLGGHFMTAYAVGFTPPDRVKAFLYALLLLGWVATLTAAGDRFASAPKRRGSEGIVAIAMAALLCVNLMGGPNSRAALRGLPRALGEWRSQNAVRESAIAAQLGAGRRDLLLPPVAPPPPPLIDPQISDDPAWWVNSCAARYRAVATLRAQGVVGPAPRRLWRGEK